MIWHPSRSLSVLISFVLVGGLTACEQGTHLAQQVASAAAATVGKELRQQANQMVEQVANETKSVLAPLGIDASKVAGRVKESVPEQVKQVLSPGTDWRQLDTLVGQQPREAGLFTPASPIMPDLNKLLGPDLPVFIEAMTVQEPLQKERVLYVIGQKKNSAAGATAWLLIDTENRKLEAGLIRKGKLQVYSNSGDALYRPSKIAMQIGTLVR